MSNYVPHFTKKRERLARLEQDLLRSIHSGTPHERLLVLADEVRHGKIRALRAEHAHLEETPGDHSDRFTMIHQKVAALETASPETILAEYLANHSPSHS